MKLSSKNQPFRKRLLLILSAVAFLGAGSAIGAITVSSGESESAAKYSSTQPAVTKSSRQDQHIHLEAPASQPQELTAEDAQKLGAGLKDLVNQSTEGLVEVKHADGSVSLDQQGRFQSVTVARINKDGSITQSCVDNPQAAAAFFGIDPKLIDKDLESGSARPNLKAPASRN